MKKLLLVIIFIQIFIIKSLNIDLEEIRSRNLSERSPQLHKDFRRRLERFRLHLILIIFNLIFIFITCIFIISLLPDILLPLHFPIFHLPITCGDVINDDVITYWPLPEACKTMSLPGAKIIARIMSSSNLSFHQSIFNFISDLLRITKSLKLFLWRTLILKDLWRCFCGCLDDDQLIFLKIMLSRD